MGGLGGIKIQWVIVFPGEGRGGGREMSKFSAGYPNSDVLFLGLHDPPFLCVY